VDFFRALMRGAAPRRCHNCGRFFLLTAGYDTRYCNNIAPGETEKTCKKIGAYRTQERKRESSVIQAEYQRTYNRLKARRQRGKLTYDDWNAAVAVAQELKAGAERGEVSEFEAKRRFEAM
jgi:DNA replication protein DnaC